MEKIKNGIFTAYSSIIEHIKEMGYNTKEDIANFEDTPARCKKALLTDFVWPKDLIKDSICSFFTKSFPSEHECGIVATDCTVISMCPHHLLPVFYQVHVGYLPKDKGKLLGASKLVRVCEVLAKRPVLQEQFVQDVANVLYEGDKYWPGLGSAGAFCFVGALHTCMCFRGVKSFSILRGASLTGVFKTNPSLKEEAYALIKTFPSVSFPFGS